MYNEDMGATCAKAVTMSDGCEMQLLRDCGTDRASCHNIMQFYTCMQPACDGDRLAEEAVSQGF